MVELFVAGNFEGVDLTALRVYAGHNVLDDAIFSRGVHRLKNQEQGPTVLRIKLFLHVFEGFGTALENSQGLLFGFHAGGAGGVIVLEAEFVSLLDAERPSETRGFSQKLRVLHTRKECNTGKSFRTVCRAPSQTWSEDRARGKKSRR